MSRRLSTVECLGTRRLCSHGSDDPVIIADQGSIADDKALYVSHRHDLEVQLGDDRRGMIEARHQRDLDVAPLKQKYIDDLTTGRSQLSDDLTALRATVQDDRLTMHDIVEQIHAHRGDDAAVAIDLSNLTAARTALIAHVASGRATIQQHHDDLVTTITDDRLAIMTYLHTDSTAMTTARQKFKDDHQHGLNELNDDRRPVDR